MNGFDLDIVAIARELAQNEGVSYDSLTRDEQFVWLSRVVIVNNRIADQNEVAMRGYYGY